MKKSTTIRTTMTGKPVTKAKRPINVRRWRMEHGYCERSRREGDRSMLHSIEVGVLRHHWLMARQSMAESLPELMAAQADGRLVTPGKSRRRDVFIQFDCPCGDIYTVEIVDGVAHVKRVRRNVAMR